jgi:hypothetical protein
MVARVLILVAALSGALAACKKHSQVWCEMHPGDLDNCGYLDAGIDARPTCSIDQDCAPAAPYCEMNTHFCVECYDDTHCAGNEIEKKCDLSTFLCTSCTANADCPSLVCLPTGVCGDDGNVAYVDPDMGADNAKCSFEQKCKTIAKALMTGKPNIKLQGAISENAIAIDGRNLTIVAEPGTTLTRPMGGVILTITGASDVAIYDLTINGNAEKGIVADMNSTLRLTRVTVTDCNMKDKRAIEAKNATLLMDRSRVIANVGGGILADASSIYQITNSFIYRNGADDSAVGGASLLSASSAFNRFEFNTVIDNHAKTVAGGAQCAASIATPNNLVARNYSAGVTVHTAVASTQTGGSCNFAQSQQAADADAFAFVTPDGAGPWDYHLTAGSMAIDRGVTSDITHDVDGDARPLGAKVDVGADEFKQ